MDSSLAERVFEYDNYRFYLRDFFREQKRQKEIFSHRFFARRAGFASSSFCAHVIEGKRNLTAESLRKVIRGLGLTGKAAAYFEALVYYNQARTVEDREHYFRLLERLRRSTQFYRIHQKQFEYYDEWYYPVIRELAVYADWQGDYARLGRLVRPPVSPEKARAAVETLLRIGLLVRTADGRLRQSAGTVTAEEVPSAVTRKTRKEFIMKSIEAMESLPVDKRHIACATVAMSEETFRQVVQKLDEVRKEILSAAMGEQKVDKVYQFNFQAFPLSEEIGYQGNGLNGGGTP